MDTITKQAYEWALNQKHRSVAADYARRLAQYIEAIGDKEIEEYLNEIHDTIQTIIKKALEENRLAWKLFDQEIGSCNGGSGSYRDYLPTETSPGPWLPTIEKIRECYSGYHVTLEPHKWRGLVVYLVETKEPIIKPNKQVVSTYRMLRRVYSDECIDQQLLTRVRYPLLAKANLAGADLAGADLARADLAGADLAGADLAEANLAGAYRLHSDHKIAGWRVSKSILIKDMLEG